MKGLVLSLEGVLWDMVVLRPIDCNTAIICPCDIERASMFSLCSKCCVLGWVLRTSEAIICTLQMGKCRKLFHDKNKQNQKVLEIKVRDPRGPHAGTLGHWKRVCLQH